MILNSRVHSLNIDSQVGSPSKSTALNVRPVSPMEVAGGIITKRAPLIQKVLGLLTSITLIS